MSRGSKRYNVRLTGRLAAWVESQLGRPLRPRRLGVVTISELVRRGLERLRVESARAAAYRAGRRAADRSGDSVSVGTLSAEQEAG